MCQVNFTHRSNDLSHIESSSNCSKNERHWLFSTIVHSIAYSNCNCGERKMFAFLFILSRVLEQKLKIHSYLHLWLLRMRCVWRIVSIHSFAFNIPHSTRCFSCCCSFFYRSDFDLWSEHYFNHSIIMRSVLHPTIYSSLNFSLHFFSRNFQH